MEGGSRWRKCQFLLQSANRPTVRCLVGPPAWVCRAASWVRSACQRGCAGVAAAPDGRWSSFHTGRTRRVSLPCEAYDAPLVPRLWSSLSHRHYRQTVGLWCESGNVPWDRSLSGRSSRRWSTRRAFLQSAASRAAWERTPCGSLCRTRSRGMVSPRCECAGEPVCSSHWWTSSHSRDMSSASLWCGFSCAPPASLCQWTEHRSGGRRQAARSGTPLPLPHLLSLCGWWRDVLAELTDSRISSHIPGNGALTWSWIPLAETLNTQTNGTHRA